MPGKLRSVTDKRIRWACHAESALKAEAELQTPGPRAGPYQPSAAASLREGMAETLAALRLEVPPPCTHATQSPGR